MRSICLGFRQTCIFHKKDPIFNEIYQKNYGIKRQFNRKNRLLAHVLMP